MSDDQKLLPSFAELVSYLSLEPSALNASETISAQRGALSPTRTLSPSNARHLPYPQVGLSPSRRNTFTDPINLPSASSPPKAASGELVMRPNLRHLTRQRSLSDSQTQPPKLVTEYSYSYQRRRSKSTAQDTNRLGLQLTPDGLQNLPHMDQQSQAPRVMKFKLRSSTSLKPFQCEYCGYSCKDRSNMRKHKRTHTGEKPYGCDICGNHFAQRSSLTRHVRQIHQKKELQKLSSRDDAASSLSSTTALSYFPPASAASISNPSKLQQVSPLSSDASRLPSAQSFVSPFSSSSFSGSPNRTPLPFGRSSSLTERPSSHIFSFPQT